MSVNGINGNSGANQTQHTPHSPVVGTQSGTVGTQTGTPEPTEENVPLVGTADEPTSDVPPPSPDSDPGAYADSLEEQIETQEDLMELRDQLEYLAEHGDAVAADFLAKLDAALLSDSDYEDLLEEYDNYADYTANGDLDGDGVKNKDDPDIDGDGLTNEAEDANGTNKYDVDTDHDGITDYGELWLQQHNYSFTWMDPLDADANDNGIIDGMELPSSVTVDNNGVPIKVGATPPDAGTSGSGEGVDATSANYQWSPPAGDATAPVWGDTVPAGAGDVVVNLAGENIELSASADGDDLIITNKDTGETITIEDYKSRKVFFEGTAGALTTNNFSPSNLNATDTDGDGYADTGVHFASTINTTSIENNYDPFFGSMPIDDAASTPEEMVYNADGAAGTFTVPSEIDGQEITSVNIVVEGDDVIIECKGSPDGPAIKKFRLKGGLQEFENFDISVKLDDKGQYVYCEQAKGHFIGGTGDDYITGKAGSWIEGGDGSDVIRLSGTDNGGILDGGAGDDYIEGSDGNDTLKGGEGEGMDLIMGNNGVDNADGGDGDDILVFNDFDNDTVTGGGGQDMTNSLNNPTQTEVNISLSSFMDFLEGQTSEASGALLEELIEAGELTETGQEQAAEAVANATSSLLSQKKAERYNSYGGTHETDIPEPEEEEPVGP